MVSLGHENRNKNTSKLPPLHCLLVLFVVYICSYHFRPFQTDFSDSNGRTKTRSIDKFSIQTVLIFLLRNSLASCKLVLTLLSKSG